MITSENGDGLVWLGLTSHEVATLAAGARTVDQGFRHNGKARAPQAYWDLAAHCQKSSRPAVPNEVPNPPDRSGWYSTTEAGDLLGIGPRGVVKSIHAGTLDAVKSGKSWEIDPKSVQRLMERIT